MGSYFVDLLICFMLVIFGADTCLSQTNLLRSMHDDILQSYFNVPSSEHSHRKIRSVQHVHFGNSTYEQWKSHSSTYVLPITNTSYFVSDIYETTWMKRHVYGHYTIVRNPHRSFSVLEPLPSGCKDNSTSTVEITAKARNCIAAQNGGFFKTETGACIGNIVSDGEIIQNGKGVLNAHFGVTKNGTILTGYFSEADLYKLNFSQLVGGVIWLVRNGTSFVEEAVRIESRDAEDTGTLRYFADIISARTAIGHDRSGRIVFVQIDGQTGVRGVNLEGFAKFLIEELGVVNAINLDGGGSATLVLNGTLANVPSDHCVGAPMWRCARAVSTVICAHEPDCNPECKNGKCVLGLCDCYTNWKGPTCDTLFCGPNNCSQHGNCKSDGCLCSPGWHGIDCSYVCPKNFFGGNCTQQCFCENESKCDPVTGKCHCLSGFKGKVCDQVCPLGTYGKNCQYNCHCSESCLCDSKTGVCLSNNATNVDQTYFNGIKRDSVKPPPCVVYRWAGDSLTRRPKDPFVFFWPRSMLLLLCLASAALMVSLIFNVLLMWKYISSKPANHGTNYRNCSSRFPEVAYESGSTFESSSEEEDEDVETDSRSRIKHFFQDCFRFRPSQYTKLKTTDEVYEMDNLNG